LDLREATRAEVIAAVRDAQGQEPQPAAMPPTVKGLRERVRTVLDNFRKEIQRFDAAQREMIEELETPLSKLNQALAEGEGWTRSPASSPPPARTARRPANLPRGPTPTTPAPGRRRRPADTRRRCRPETVRPAAPAHQRPRKRPETLTPGTVWPTTAAGHDSVAPKLFAPKGDCDAI
jgi:hypothetical protein